MNTLKPLAAAFLLLTSSASAATSQPFGATQSGTGGGFSMTGGNGGYSNPLSFANMSGSGPIPDASFTCSSMDNVHIPYASCTESQLSDRKRFNGECPAKSTACKEYLQRQLSGNNPAGTIAAYTPPPGQQWASPSCTHIPCRLADSPAEGDEIVVTGRRKEPARPGDDGFIGPPLPPGWGAQNGNGGVVSASNKQTPAGAPAMTEQDFQKSLEAVRETHGDRVVDLGNKTYGILDEAGDGMSICGPTTCSRGKQSDHQDKIQQARAENFAFNNNSNTPAGGNAGNNKTGGQTSGGTPPPADDTSGAPGGGGSLGREFADDQASISGSGGGDSSSGGSGSGNTGFGDGKGYIAVKPSEVAPVGSIQITHTALLKTEAEINNTQRAFNNGQTGFAAPNDDTGSDAGDPPISPEHLGKIQAVENGPAQK